MDVSSPRAFVTVPLPICEAGSRLWSARASYGPGHGLLPASAAQGFQRLPPPTPPHPPPAECRAQLQAALSLPGISRSTWRGEGAPRTCVIGGFQSAGAKAASDSKE